MTAVDELRPRIAALDIVRGVAVMGILAMNIVVFAMPFPAYMNPVAFGAPSAADLISWAFSFIFIDGKMRGLFSFLFGASMLLVIENATARGESAGPVHFRRMLWLLAFGLVHLYLIWSGDILTSYALLGMIAWFFRNLSPRALIGSGIVILIVQLLILVSLAAGAFYLQAAAMAPGATAELVAEWQGLERQFGVLTGQHLAKDLAIHRGGYSLIVAHRLDESAPVKSLLMFGWETLAYFLFGMAALKNGFLRGSWSPAAYRRAAMIGFGIGIPAYGLLAWILARDGFSVPMVIAITMTSTVPFRPLMVIATAALIIILARQGSALVERIAAVGRAAFSNYLGTSLLMTIFFYGYGLGFYGTMGRAELWLVVVAMWALMLLWSTPWLERYRYGPLEWLWRTLARGGAQPMRRPLPAA